MFGQSLRRYLGGVLLIIGLVAMHHLAITACHHGNLLSAGIHGVQAAPHSGDSVPTQDGSLRPNGAVDVAPAMQHESGAPAVDTALTSPQTPEVPSGLLGSLCLAVLLLLMCLRPVGPVDARQLRPTAQRRLQGRIPDAPDLRLLAVSRT